MRFIANERGLYVKEKIEAIETKWKGNGHTKIRSVTRIK